VDSNSSASTTARKTLIAVSVSSTIVVVGAFLFVIWYIIRRRKNAAGRRKNAFDALKFYKSVTIAADEAHYRNISRDGSFSPSRRDSNGGDSMMSGAETLRRGSMMSEMYGMDQPLQGSRRESMRSAFNDVTPNPGSGDNSPSGYSSPIGRSRRQSMQPMLGNQHQASNDTADFRLAFSRAMRSAGK